MSFYELTLLDRRKFLAGLLCSGASLGVLPMGISEVQVVRQLPVPWHMDFARYLMSDGTIRTVTGTQIYADLAFEVSETDLLVRRYGKLAHG